MNVLGISCYFHDAAAALLSDGKLVAAAEEERFTRVKHDYAFPRRAIDFCLAKAGIRAEELDQVVFFEKPFVKFERLLLTSMQTFPRSRRVFKDAMIAWLGDKLWIKQLLQKTLRVEPEKIFFAEHHLSHAASAFYCSPFEEAAILTVDGVGEWTTASLGVGRGTEIRLLKEIRFPHSLGLLYSAFTAFLGFEVNEGEYKVMGMAPFGSPRYVDQVRKLVRIDADGSFELDLDYFSFHYSPDRTFSHKFEALFGEPRDPQALFFTRSIGWPAYFGAKPGNYEALARSNERYADVAASIQAVTEDALLRMATEAHRETGLRRLCMAGGVALNSVANGRIMRETPFDEIFIQPSAGDGGAALGAALFGYHGILGKPRRFVLEHAYWGEEHGPGDVEAFLRGAGVPYRRMENDDELIATVAGRLLQGNVVGWSQGRFEWGPRALGNRSILADPRRREMKDIVNTKIKFREPFRPFAPAVLQERACRYFDVAAKGASSHAARFMLSVCKVKAEQQPRLEAITHVDGSARLQTVRAEDNPRFYRLIDAFGAASGVPVLLNTSFNLRGEPIVNTPAEAFRTFARSGMDLLVLGDCLIDKSELGTLDGAHRESQ